MEKSPKISVITIVYMVEDYFRQCLDSLVNQTYQNLELILVLGQKDGKSLDGCEEIAKEFAASDERIKLVFCEANGPADARNKGLEAVSGDILAFVDSDDYIEPDMFERMVKNLIDNDADISICGRFYEFKNHTGADSGNLVVMNPREALKIVICDGGFFLHCWDKIYTKKIFEGLYFPIEKQVEDRIVVNRLLAKADRIVYDPEPKYHFRERFGSVSKSLGWEKYNDMANEELVNFIKSEYPDLSNECGRFYLYETITCLQNLLMQSTCVDKAAIKACRNKISSQLRSERGNSLISQKLKFKAYLSIFMPGILKIITKNNMKKTNADFERYP